MRFLHARSQPPVRFTLSTLCPVAAPQGPRCPSWGQRSPSSAHPWVSVGPRRERAGWLTMGGSCDSGGRLAHIALWATPCIPLVHSALCWPRTSLVVGDTSKALRRDPCGVVVDSELSEEIPCVGDAVDVGVGTAAVRRYPVNVRVELARSTLTSPRVSNSPLRR